MAMIAGDALGIAAVSALGKALDWQSLPMAESSEPTSEAGGRSLAPLGQFNSSLCQITWTEAAHGTQRFAFPRAKPLTLRFGLQLAPSLWSSLKMCHIEFQVFFRGYLSYGKDLFVETSQLPGAPSEELWLGLSLGQAGQVTENLTGIAAFRPQVWFTVGDIPDEFAAAREDCHFVVAHGSYYDTDGTFEKFVGGSGQPES